MNSIGSQAANPNNFLADCSAPIYPLKKMMQLEDVGSELHRWQCSRSSGLGTREGMSLRS